VVVAVIAVRMVQAAVDQIIEVVAVRHLLMAATFMLAVAGSRGAVVGVRRAHRQGVLAVVAVVRVVQMAVVQVIDVAVVLEARVPAVFTVGVLVVVVDMVAHRSLLLEIRVGDFIGSPYILSPC
jgi:hypothetical protein